jgi:CDP-glycerol glycerophosphotransferase (TagB/SpsB family)
MRSKILKYLYKIPYFLFWYSIYLLSFSIPRKQNICVFGSYGGLFNDNSKYHYLYVCHNIPTIKAIWISKNKLVCESLQRTGYNAFYTYSIKGILYSLFAKYYFYSAYISDINFFTSGNAIGINLWHGIPIKKIEFDIKSGPLAKLFSEKKLKYRITSPATFRRPNYFLSSSPFMTEIFARSFRINKSQCLEYGLPRNDLLLTSQECLLEYIKKREPKYIVDFIQSIKRYKKVYIYLPTWRDSGLEFLENAKIDFRKLNKCLCDNNELLLIKFHANTNIYLDDFKLYTNIMKVDNSWDIYPILPFTDVLITDYSSIYYDYILMKGKRVILFTFDYDKYISERELNIEYEKYFIGLRVHSFDQLYDVIKKKEVDNISFDYNDIIKNIWNDYDGKANYKLTSKLVTL